MDRISLGSPCLRNPASSSCHPSIAQPSSRHHDAARDDFETHLLATRARSLKGSGSVHLSRTPAPQSPIQEKNLSLGSSKLGSLFPPFPHTKGVPETPRDKKTITWKQEVGHCAPLERWDVGSNKLLPVIPCSPRHSENWVQHALGHCRVITSTASSCPTCRTSTAPLLSTLVPGCIPSHIMGFCGEKTFHLSSCFLTDTYQTCMR